MTEQPTVQEVLAKIRERVQSRASSTPARSITPASVRAAASRGRSSHTMPRYDLAELRRHLYDCEALRHAVGMVNPRHPGFHNRAIQFFKRILQRSLEWYTRPLRQFLEVQMHAVNEMANELENLANAVDQLRNTVERLEQNLSTTEETKPSAIGDQQSAGPKTL